MTRLIAVVYAVLNLFQVRADLVVKPCDTEAVIGDSIYFDCASNVNTNEVNWYRYAVGAKDHEDICLYCLGKVHPNYEQKIQVDLKQNISTRNSRLMIKSVQQQDAGRYICQDNGGIGESSSAELVILDVEPNNSTTKMVQGTKENVFCSVNSSQSCIYTWKWFNGVHEEIVSNGSALVTHKPGWYKCESKCNIRGKQCTVLSTLVHVSEPQTRSMPVVIAVSCMAMFLCAGLICIVILRNRTRSEESRRLIEAEVQTNGVSTITTKDAKEKGLLIRGMTILDNELFVVTQKCSTVEVFDCKTLTLSRQWTLSDLIRPADIASCTENGCLYIVDWKGDSQKKEVHCVDPNGALLRNWETGDEQGYLISVTNEKNIILTFHGKSAFKEYSPEGKVIREIILQELAFSTHAVKLTNGDFIVGIGDLSHMLHRVCMVDVYGRLKKSFGKERGSDLDHMDHPMRLAVFADGSVAVLDSGNQRVLLLCKDLKFNRVLLSLKNHGLKNPTRLLLDESNGRMFLAGSRNGIGEILVFTSQSFCLNV